MKHPFRGIFAAGLLAGILAPVHAGAAESIASGVIYADQPGAVINRNIYGHFSEHLGRCIYEGIWVGEDSPIPNTRGIRNDTVAALKAIQVPVLRWPGGCFADEYHWKDGIGPREKRPEMINTNWGGVVENNHFGTHEFLDLCEQIGAEPYVSINVGSGTVQEAMEWVEYMTSDADSPMTRLRKANGREQPWKIKYLGLGNENWGCGGNMRPEYYADVYRRFNTFAKNYGENRLYRVACGPAGSDYTWTETLMTLAGDRMDGLSIHYYTLPTGSWTGSKGSATDFEEAAWHATLWQTLRMDELVTRHSAIMDRHDPDKRVGMIVDEWGTWYDVEPGTNPGFLYQQNTLRDAVVAGLNLNIFHRHADRVTMANIAQVINVLQAMILTDKERLVLTPTYHVFEMYKVHQDATSLRMDVSSPDYVFGDQRIASVSGSASKDSAGRIHVSLVNTDPNRPVRVSLRLSGVQAGSVKGRVLTAATMQAHNSFDAPRTVEPAAFSGATVKDGMLNVALPAKSVVVLEVR